MGLPIYSFDSRLRLHAPLWLSPLTSRDAYVSSIGGMGSPSAPRFCRLGALKISSLCDAPLGSFTW
eukprot:11591742-Heterocapsa_arctica.AAC.1